MKNEKLMNEGMENKETSYEKIGIGCFALGVMPFGWVAGSFVFMKFWEWFIELQFHAPHIGLPHAMGIMLTIRLALYKKSKSDEFTIKSILNDFLVLIGTLSCVLLMGWVASKLM
jgi:hypothetical protein